MTPPSPNAEILAPGVHVAHADMRYSFSRSSGPGGQSVNKVSTRAELRVSIDAIQGLTERAVQRLRTLAGQRLVSDEELLIQADTHRSQTRNRQECLDRLTELVTRAAREPKKRKRTKPSRGAVERRLKSKREHSEKKQRRQGP